MIQNLILIKSYGIFVWSSFIITFLSCAFVYYRTRKTLKKYEQEFAKEIKELSKDQRKIVLANSRIASQVLSSYNKTF